MAEQNGSWDLTEALFQELIEEQEKKLLLHGRRLISTLTPEDILQPNDYPELENNPAFRYEEGLLTGIRSAYAAFKALRRERNF